MPTNIQTLQASGAGTNKLTAENAEFYSRQMLTRLKDENVYMKYGTKKPISKNSGDTISFRRLELPNVSTTAIVEGTTPDGLDLTINKISATVNQFGDWTKITDRVELMALDPMLSEVATMFGEYAGIKADTIMRDILEGGTQVQYSNGVASRATVAAGITAAEIRKVRTSLKKQKVKGIKLPNGKTGYLAFAHPDIIDKLMTLTEWTEANKYQSSDAIKDGIVGQLYGVYFMEVPHAKVYTGAGAASADVYSTLVIGADAYGVVDVDGSAKPEFLVFNEGSTENPLALYSTSGYKMLFTGVRLQEKAILRLETTKA